MTMNSPLVSIIIPTKNRCELLKETLAVERDLSGVENAKYVI
jgi:hypothetical protein